MSVDLNAGSTVLGHINIPATGGWQSWQTVEQEVEVNAGTYNLGFFALTSNWNFNWIEVEPLEPITPSHFEAEDYSKASDTTSGYSGGGYNVGWITAGEWLAFDDLNIPRAGSYQIQARVASVNVGALSVGLNGGDTLLGTMKISATGGW
jgi:hypothetical protein